MPYGYSRRHAVAVACGAALAAGRPAKASLFSSFDLEQNVNYNIEANPPLTGTSVVSDTVAPFQKTAALNASGNGMVSSTYGVYDAGTAAGISINTSGVTTAQYTYVGEGTGSGGSDFTTFAFSQPVNYLISIDSTGSAAGEGNFRLISFTTQPQLVETIFGAQQFNLSGMFTANTVYYLQEGWALSNQPAPPGSNYNLAGTESITMTFTPVPEPTSVAVVAAVALTLLRRRCRR